MPTAILDFKNNISIGLWPLRGHILASERSKLESRNFRFMGIKIKVFWVKDFKNNIRFGLRPLGGHILASKWPQKNFSFMGIKILASWLSNKGLLGQGFQK